MVLRGGAVFNRRDTPVDDKIQSKELMCTQGRELQAQGRSRTCNESKDEEKKREREGEQPCRRSMGT